MGPKTPHVTPHAKGELKMRNTLSVCMIVRNEQECIDKCLESIIGYADKVIIVDTGSTDKTVEEALKYTDLVYFMDWKDDFGAARNYAFSLANTDYIMWLDADEVVPQETMGIILETINEENPPQAISMYTVMCDVNGEPQGLRFRRERVVRRDLGCKWIGFIHEYLNVPLHLNYPTSLEIFHTRKANSDPQRNLNIYESKINQGHILSDRDQYYYGKELFYNLKYDLAALVLEDFVSKDVWIEDKLDAYVKLADCYTALKKEEDLLRVFRKGLETEPRAEMVYRVGNYYLDKNMPSTAILYYEAILAMEIPVDSPGFVNLNEWKLYPHIQSVVAYHKLNKMDRAIQHHRASKSIDPDHPAVKYNDLYFSEHYTCSSKE